MGIKMQQDIKRLSVYLPPSLEAEVRARVENGEFRTVCELLRSALRTLIRENPRAAA